MGEKRGGDHIYMGKTLSIREGITNLKNTRIHGKKHPSNKPTNNKKPTTY